MKKVYFLINNFKLNGGVEKVTLMVANLLADYFDTTLISLSESGFDKSLVNPSLKIKFLKVDETYFDFFKNEKDLIKKVKLISCFKAFNNFMSERKKTRKELAKIIDDEDVIIGTAPINYTVLPSKGKRIMWWHFNSEHFQEKKEKIARLFAPHFDYYIFLTENDWKKLKKKNSVYIYNPSSLERNKRNSTEHNLLFVGRLSYQKNIPFLLEVLNELKNRNFNFKCYLPGYFAKPEKEIYKRESDELINKFNLKSNLVLLPYVSNIQKFYDDASLLLLTSRFEGLPLAIIEGASRSVPFISTDWGGGLDELIDRINPNGMVLPDNPKLYANEIIKLFENPQKLIEMQNNSFKFSEKFSKKEILKKWIRLIKGIFQSFQS